jgi:hypothetical protein
VQSYYRKIDPIILNKIKYADHWVIDTVSIAGKKISPNRGSNGYYSHKHIHFHFYPSKNFDPDIPLNILVHRFESHNIQFTKFIEKKIPHIPLSCDNYNQVLEAMHSDRAELNRHVTFKGVIPISGKNPCIILITCKNFRPESIRLQGMEIVYCEDERKTKIFFDFTDDANEPAYPSDPIEYKHSKNNIDTKVSYIKKNKVYKPYEKAMYELFDRKEICYRWIPNKCKIYDLNHHILISLPYHRNRTDNHQEIPQEPMDWFFNGTDDSLHRIPEELWELIFLAQNKYFAIEPEMLAQCKSATQWCAMKNIINTSLVCKRFNVIAQKLLPSYTKEIKGYIDILGGKDQAACDAFINNGSEWFKVREICKAMKADLNAIKYTDSCDRTLLTQAIRSRDEHKIEQLLQGGIDPKYRDKRGDMPIDLAYANGLVDAAHMIKDKGGDPANKYEYKNGNFVCKQGRAGQAYAPQQNNGATANNNPAPAPDTQTSFFSSWIVQSPSYLLFGYIAAAFIVYGFYTKYYAKNTEQEKAEINDSEVNEDNEEKHLDQTQSYASI